MFRVVVMHAELGFVSRPRTVVGGVTMMRLDANSASGVRDHEALYVSSSSNKKKVKKKVTRRRCWRGRGRRLRLCTRGGQA